MKQLTDMVEKRTMRLAKEKNALTLAKQRLAQRVNDGSSEAWIKSEETAIRLHTSAIAALETSLEDLEQSEANELAANKINPPPWKGKNISYHIGRD